ncbi:N-acetyltransferase [Shimia sp. R10_1]|uniref:GNAT family N-acetyltransferase n=1 Tax=Shimia sp. R10_1 TaxID=2821095 RepID=UPI001ADD2620|nr:GNAT family N-acetyltransferase [Shimia sp. R10_1]MBO9473595.1 N-acetyltransferase [Shimia sp. R10_1]
MRLRTAEISDAEAIAAIWNREIRDGVSTFTTVEKTTEAVRAALEQAVFLVAVRNGQVVGFATYGPFRAGPGYLRTVEHTVYLAEAARGQGMGRALLAALELAAKAAGHHVMVAGVGGENTGGIDFHKRMGFEEVGRLPEVGRKFDRWMDLVLLQKML